MEVTFARCVEEFPAIEVFLETFIPHSGFAFRGSVRIFPLEAKINKCMNECRTIGMHQIKGKDRLSNDLMAASSH